MLVAVLASASGVLYWGVVSEDSGFRPTAPAALVVGLAVTAGARVLAAPRIGALLCVMSLAGAAALLVIPAGAACDPPIAEFVPHAFEDAAGPHEHDRCQLESDRRSLAGLVLAGGGVAAIVLLVQRSPVARLRAGRPRVRR